MNSLARLVPLLYILLAASAKPAQAATLNVVGGQLWGASGVIVDGQSFTVTFVEGTCAAIFGGCDDASTDFAFTTQGDAALAAQALLDQVFINTPLASDDFDTDPEKTFGCSSLSTCTAYIPFALGAANTGLVNTMGARNGAEGGTGFNDSVFGGATGFGFDFDDWDTSTLGPSVYAVFSAEVPAPASAWLFLSATLGFFRFKRKTKSKATR